MDIDPYENILWKCKWNGMGHERFEMHKGRYNFKEYSEVETSE